MRSHEGLSVGRSVGLGEAAPGRREGTRLGVRGVVLIFEIRRLQLRGARGAGSSYGEADAGLGRRNHPLRTHHVDTLRRGVKKCPTRDKSEN